jgi:hypothetical protein
MDGEWTTVKSKAYVPPHLKKAAEASAPKALNFDCSADFPSLGGTPKGPGLWIKAKANSSSKNDLTLDDVSEGFPSLGGSSVVSTPMKMTFTQKIKELIATEQQNETDRAVAEEKKRELDGFVSLPLKFTPERYMEWSDKIHGSLQTEKNFEDLTQFLNGYVQSLPYPVSFPITDIDETYTVLSNDFQHTFEEPEDDFGYDTY